MSKVRDNLMRIQAYDVDEVEAIKKGMRAEMRAYQLREVREQAYLTQAQLAERLHVSQNRISGLERGDLQKTQIDTLKRYVEALGGRLRIEVDVDDRTISLV